EDNFFALGGHSILATRVISQVRQSMGVELSLVTLFEQPTVSGLAAALSDEIDSHEQVQLMGDITPVGRDKDQSLSYAQQRLWFIEQLEGSSSQYNMPFAFRLDGELDVAALQRSFHTIVQRHEVLRTRLVLELGETSQILRESFELPLNVTDFSEFDEDEQRQRVNQAASDDRAKVFDLGHDILLRVQLLKLAQQSHVMLFNMHHIASDGWSTGIIINEFISLYTAYRQGEANPLAPLKIQYADFAHWQRQWLSGDVLTSQLDYWTQQLANIPTVHSLPLDKVRPAQQSFNGKALELTVDADLTKQINNLCQQQGVTLFMLLHTAFSVLLGRYSNESDIVMGSPIAGRLHQDIEPLIGFFVNTLVLRTSLEDDVPFSTLLKQNKRMILAAYNNQSVSFEMLVEALKPQRSLSHSPLYQVMITLQNFQQDFQQGKQQEQALALPGLELTPIEQQNNLIKFDLELSVVERGDELALTWRYNSDLFVPDTINRMMDNFGVLLGGIVKAPQQRVADLPLLTKDQSRQLGQLSRASQTTFPLDLNLDQLFEAQVSQTPDTVAVVFDHQQLSFRQLNERANQLAHYLIEQGVKPQALVGLSVYRSLEMVIGVLAILKAGGAYVALDPDYPQSRLDFMVRDSGIELLLSNTDVEFTGADSTGKVTTISMDEPTQQQQIAQYSRVDPQRSGQNSANLAYVIYTSGTTGQPKGVLIEHRAVTNFISVFEQQLTDLSVAQLNGWLMSSSIAFDASVKGLISLALGATVVVASSMESRDPQALLSLINQYGVNVFNSVPEMVEQMLDLLPDDDSGPKLSFIVGGDKVSANLWSRLADYCDRHDTKAINAYGPTESTINATYAVISANSAVNIGKAIGNVETYVLDKHQQLSAYGAIGELYLGGSQLARGYLNREQLTAETFITNPFAHSFAKSSERLYRTGDLVRLVDDQLHFMGRVDDQVKILGFRIETNEIENRLNQLEAVASSVVVIHLDNAGVKFLVGYFTVAEGSAETSDKDQTTQIRQALEQQLPQYMVPALFVMLDEFPLTPTGKIDKKALPAPDAKNRQKTEYVPPANITQMQLCGIWQDIIGVEKVGINDHFFELGGHSLLATRVISQIHQVMS
ncbi:MAG: amino acid adenylation domain-containing protein, partial [Algicola sp.]|nr:amino acid adenylation domain-containing protein [Algicola sp.]